MEYNHKLLSATVTGVYNEIIIDARLENGEAVAAFCGAPEIAEMCTTGTPLWLKRTSRGKRLVKYNISFVQTPEGLVFANPRYLRQLFQEAFDNSVLTDLKEYTRCTPLEHADTTLGTDFELTAPDGQKCFVFALPVYHKKDSQIVFPFAVNFFEMKMIEKMRQRRQKGAKTYIFMIAPREDCVAAKFIWNADAAGAAVLFEEAKNGLNFLCYGCKTTKNRIEIDRRLEIIY